MVLFDTIDIPNTVVNARFLHRLVGYPDQDHDPNIDGMIGVLMKFWRWTQCILLQTALVIQIGRREFIS